MSSGLVSVQHGCLVQIPSQAHPMPAAMTALQKRLSAGTSKNASTPAEMKQVMTVMQMLAEGGIEASIDEKASTLHVATAHLTNITGQSTRKRKGDLAPPAAAAEAVLHLTADQEAKEVELTVTLLIQLVVLMLSEQKSGQCWATSDMPCFVFVSGGYASSPDPLICHDICLSQAVEAARVHDTGTCIERQQLHVSISLQLVGYLLAYA